MFLRKSFDKKTGIYRSSDSIDNFKFRVTLKKLNCLIRVPKLNTTATTASGHPTAETTATTSSNHDAVDDTDELETHTIQWHEKRLSQKEIDFYNDQENCATDIHKEYHRFIKINGLHDENRMYDKIFTYVPDDCYAPPSDDDGTKDDVSVGATATESGVGANKEFNLNAVRKQRRTKHRRRRRRQRMREKSGGGENDEEAISQHNNNDTSDSNSVYETMYVMADLVASVETVLFIIRWNSREGLLLVYPDFNVIHSNPYLKEINADSRHMYQYSLENLSNATTVVVVATEDVDTADDWQLNSELQVISNKLSGLSVNAALSSMFISPPRRCTNVYLFGTILSADCFEYDNIHVRYRVTLPDRCEIFGDDGAADETVTCNSLLLGSTHSSRKSVEDGIWRIGHCYELNLRCMDDYRFHDVLKISYEVISIDGWQRERTEGYAVQAIPFQAGQATVKLRCFRETSNSIVERLERYFIGGRREFHLDAFHGISNKTEKVCTNLNRYGNQTKSTGSLTVANRIIIQRDVNFFADNSNNHKATVSLGFTEQNGTTTSVSKQITVDDVVVAYQKAKQRLEATTLMRC